MRAWPQWAVAACLLIATTTAHADVLWQIGTPDGDYRDLAIPGRYQDYTARFPRDATFRVGASKPTSDWPFIQPGPTDAWAGARQHTFRIVFDVQEVPTTACRVTLHLLDTHPTAPPVVEIAVNGKTRSRFQTPPGPNELALTDPAAGRRTRLSLPFSAASLRPGRNEIDITNVAGSWLIYDAVTLESGVDIPTTPVVEGLGAECTPFFRRQGSALRQALAVTVSNGGTDGEVEVEATGAVRETQRFPVVPGSNLLHLLVPPFGTPGRVTVVVRAGGKETRTEVECRPERTWTLYVAPESHTDIGYTDLQPRTFARHDANVDAAMRAAASDPQLRWDLEVAWQARAFASGLPDPMAAPMAVRQSPGKRAEFYRLLQQGRLGLMGLYLNMLTGLCDGEELARVVAWPQEIGLAHGFDVPVGGLTDVPTAVGTLPMLLHQAGARYFMEGINQSHGPVFRHETHPPHQAPFWWEALDGTRVLTVLADGYAQGSGLGMENGVDEMARRLPGWLHGFDRPDYAPDAVLVYGMVSDNLLVDPRYARNIEEWNRRWEYPKVVQCRPDAFFRYVEGKFGRQLPVLRGDMGVFWEDGAGSSAHETGLTRWARAQVETAQRLDAIMGMLRGGAGVQRRATTAKASAPTAQPMSTAHTAWENTILYDEHTWGAYNSISEPNSPFVRAQWDWKAERARTAARLADSLLAGSASTLAGAPPLAVGRGAGTARSYVVYNQHSWPRDIVASIPAPGAGSYSLRDPGGRDVPTQRSGSRVLFLARSVPPLGWASYRLVPMKPGLGAGREVLRQTDTTGGWTAGGLTFRIDQATGAVANLGDRAGREWVSANGGYGLNEYLFVTGGDNSRVVEPQYGTPQLTIHRHTRAVVELVENGPVRGVLHIRRTGEGLAPVDTWIVADAAGHIEFVNVVHKEPAQGKEAGYFAFPFAFAQGRPVQGYVGLPYGALQVGAEQMPGACRDWYCTESYAALTDGTATAVLSSPQAPLVTFNDIWRGQWRERLEPLNGTLLSYALNNYWYTNYKASQPGDILFAYSLQLNSGGFDAASATRAGWDAVSAMGDPRRASRPDVWDTAQPALPAGRVPSGSALRVLDGTALVGGMERRGSRTQVRLYNPAAQPTRCVLELPAGAIRAARLTDLAGRPLGGPPLQRRGRQVACPVAARSVATMEIEVTAGNSSR